MPEFDEQIDSMFSAYINVKKGCDVITWETIASYERLSGIHFDPFEVQMIIDIDMERRTHGR